MGCKFESLDGPLLIVDLYEENMRFFSERTILGMKNWENYARIDHKVNPITI